MNVSGAKTAVIFAIAIIAGVAAISVGLGTLDEQAVKPVMQEQDLKSGEINSEGSTQEPKPVSIDKSRYKIAPDLVGISGYINTSPESLQEAMKDKVVLYDIWTYSCINCIRTLPYITAWDEKYSDQGLLIIGIHSPEFEFEKDQKNVQRAVTKYNINYPVVLDNEMETWSAFENRYWPRKYIADHEGYIRYDHIGEGGYEESERVIQELLAERMAAFGIQTALADDVVDIKAFEHTGRTTPEIYFGYKLALPNRNYLANSEGFMPEQSVSYELPSTLSQHKFHMQGQWYNGKDSMKLLSEQGLVVLPFYAREVNIVASNPAQLRITLDGELISAEHAGIDLTDGIVSVNDARLYNIVDSPEASNHKLGIEVDGTGFEIFTFTFG